MKKKQKYDFKLQQSEWRNIPIDGIGYFSSKSLLGLPNNSLKEVINKFEATRYNPKGYRNYKNQWRKLMRLDDIKGKIILDYGCGFGIESLQFAKNNNKIILADINQENINLAERVLNVSGYEAYKKIKIKNTPPFFSNTGKVDIFYSNGVLHHIPYPIKIIKRACGILKARGEITLMVYSDKLWRIATGEKTPPISLDIRKHPKFMDFVRAGDSVGYYADWYNQEKVEKWFGRYTEIISCKYFTPDQRFLAVRLKKKT